MQDGKSTLFTWKVNLIYISIGIIYVWFGMLKFFPNMSPAEELAKNAINKLCNGLLPLNFGYLLLALVEVLLGFFLIFKITPKYTISVALLHMLATFSPLVLLPNIVFSANVVSLTLVGQYILKNLVIVAALLMIYPNDFFWDKKEN